MFEFVATYMFPDGRDLQLRCTTLPIVGDAVYFRGAFYRVVARLQVFAKTVEGTTHDTDHWHVLLEASSAPDWSPK